MRSRSANAPSLSSNGPNPRSPKKRDEKPLRRRRDAASAQAAILDATERRLVIGGPAGIRLQEVAADAGVSHPTVLHHFGSREALVKAVTTRALAEINARLAQAIAESTGEASQIATMLDNVFEALSTSGRARVVMWLALEGHKIDGTDARLADVVDAADLLRKAKFPGRRRAAPREDTAHVVVLAALALVGSAVIGSTLLGNAGLSEDAAAGERFRRWLAGLLSTHLDGDA